MKSDLSNNVSSKVFFHWDYNRSLYFVIFFFKNFNLAEFKYEIYDKKLLTIIRYFEHWKLELEKIGMPVKVNRS